MDSLYEELQLVRECLELTVSDKNLGAINKWEKVINQFTKNQILNLFRIISFVLSIPSSNCFVERIFSQMSLKWTDIRNRSSVDLIRSELLIMFNFEFNCQEFYNYVKTNKEILRTVESTSKYSFKTK
uniref:HAT C-terminal dimerisation domain-containing protein n=1 Tax=Cacopsylla melanoneura TaxID=428564 RepID=A0A8D8YCU9_9HEMI